MKTLFLALLLLAATQANAQTYKWVDENGVTHYSETRPPKQKVTEIQSQPAPPVADNQSVNPETLRWQKLEAGFQKRKVEREAAEKKQELEYANARQAAVENKTKCILSQQSLYALQQKKPVFTLDEKGERIYVSDEMRPAEIAKMKKDIETYCGHQ